jgi:hypothetical protein
MPFPIPTKNELILKFGTGGTERELLFYPFLHPADGRRRKKI